MYVIYSLITTVEFMEVWIAVQIWCPNHQMGLGWTVKGDYQIIQNPRKNPTSWSFLSNLLKAEMSKCSRRGNLNQGIWRPYRKQTAFCNSENEPTFGFELIFLPWKCEVMRAALPAKIYRDAKKVKDQLRNVYIDNHLTWFAIDHVIQRPPNIAKGKTLKWLCTSTD